MKHLEQFHGVIKVADKPLSDEYKAYYMDGGRGVREMPDLRKYVGLGSCQCCDYFLHRNNDILLIEETRLFEREENLKQKYHYLSDKHKREFVTKNLFDRNLLKVYGSLLVLYHLANKHASLKKLIHNKKYHF